MLLNRPYITERHLASIRDLAYASDPDSEQGYGAINEEGTSDAPRMHQRVSLVGDVETFAQRLVSRLSKIVPTDIIL
jgi:hypothetical protein